MLSQFNVILVIFILLKTRGISSEKDDTQRDGTQDELNHNKELDKKMAVKRSQLLAHMAERMNLDGEGLRHIRKHLIDVAGHGHLDDVLDIGRGDNIKGIFYFFRLHDNDNNQRLDGLEWLKALTDFHDKFGEQKEEKKNLKESEAVAIIDELLQKHDNDYDGMIDFVELMNTKVDSIMRELNRDVQTDEQENKQHQEQMDQQQQEQDQQQNQYQQGDQHLQQENQQQDQHQQEDQHQQQDQHLQQEQNQQKDQHQQEDQHQQQDQHLQQEQSQQQDHHQQDDQHQ